MSCQYIIFICWSWFLHEQETMLILKREKSVSNPQKGLPEILKALEVV